MNRIDGHTKNGTHAVADLPPHDAAIEGQLLACCLKDPSIIEDGKIEAADFHSSKARRIFLVIRKLLDDGFEVNRFTVGHRINEDGVLMEIGGAPYLAELAETPTDAGWRVYLDIAKRMRTRRDLYYFAADVRAEALEPMGSEAFEGLKDRFDRIGERASGIQERPPFNLIDSSTFMRTEYPRKFLVRDVLIEGEPAVLGGRKKSMKTTIIIALGVALTSGKRFLHYFDVPVKKRVAIFSGESGPSTIQETFQRICISEGLNPYNLGLFWSFKLPHLSDTAHLRQMRKVIEDNGIEVFVVDPLYLSLLIGNREGRKASDLFDMGSLLLPIAELAADTTTTPILVHHVRKGAEVNYDMPPELDDLSQSGTQEFARQWCLISRSKPYEPGTGLHQLWMATGGSAGHGGTWGITIDEGQTDGDLRGRKWEVKVETAFNARLDAALVKESRKLEAAEQARQQHREDILEALQDIPDGDTESQIRTRSGLNSKAFKPAFAKLVKEGIIEGCQVTKNRTNYAGFRLSEKGRSDSVGLSK